MGSSNPSMEQRWHVLPDGVRLEVLFAPAAPSPAAAPAARPPLLFLHGAFHGAWCWEVHFLRFFASAGYDCYALSLRGHGGSETGAGHPAGATGTLRSHLGDLASVVASLPRPPVLVVHSLSSLFAVNYCLDASEAGAPRPPLAGLAFLGAVPPSGSTSAVKRLLWRSPLRVLRAGWVMARRTFKTSNAACRLLFFSAALPEAEVERYRQKLATCGLPSMTQQERARVEAGWPSKPAAGWPGLPPARLFVGCGKEDLLVDAVAAEELAAYCGTEAVLWEGLAHDVMLDAGWRTAADALLQWLRGFQAAPAE